ncbi:MAG: hypothetical protein H0U60_09840 [Blastocatellia bacterium]|nr:hypothetical protein [Blastocatellia bacterium]
MARLISKPVKPEQLPRIPNIGMQPYADARLNKGMVTTIDPAELEQGTLVLAKNALVRFDKTFRRYGSTLFTPVKPDSNPVLRLAYIKRKDGIAYTLRMTPKGVHSLDSAAWVPVVGTLSGTKFDRIQTANVLNEMVFSNNGKNKLKKIDFTTLKIVDLGNAPTYRYITGFYNRVVGFARRDTNEVEIGWSGDGNITEWNPLVDESAGSAPLLESPADLSDFGTGIFSGPNVLIVLRERSVWLGTKQPIPQNPFYFAANVPNIGCDTPYSAVWIGDGLAWFDRRTGTVYAYNPGSAPVPIGRPIENKIIRDIYDPGAIFASYNSVANEYTIFIPREDSYVDGWTFNRRNNAWTRHEFYDICSAEETGISTGFISMDELVGTFDTLADTMDELSPPSVVTDARIFGRNDGTIAQEDESATTDAAHTALPLGNTYEMQLVSKTFTIPERNILVGKIVIEYETSVAGAVTLEYSLDNGNTWVLGKTVTPDTLNKPRLLILHKLIRVRRFAFRLLSSVGKIEVLGYEVHVYRSGQSRDGE